MKKGIVLIFVLTMSLVMLCSCGKNKEDPITKVALGMSYEEAVKIEPELTELAENHSKCSKTCAGAEGILTLSLFGLNGDPEVTSVKWDTRPTDGNGKKVYDDLFSALKSCYGKPGVSSDKKDIESATGIYDSAQARWEFEDFTVSFSYIEYHESGMCQVLYHKDIVLDLNKLK